MLTKLIIRSVLILGLSFPALATESQNFGEYTVDYTTFPSTALQEEIAAHYGIKRSKYETLLNVFVSREGEQGGVDVRIQGTVKNLLGQQQPLDFMEIKEDNTVYYIAPVRVTNEDTMHFYLQIAPRNSSGEFAVKFTRTLYKD